MSAPAFTPGPWTAEGGANSHIFDARIMAGDECVAFADADESVAPYGEDFKASANAHLIAAAPELYEALEQCLAVIADMSRFVGQMSLRDYAAFNDAPIAAERALAKARGEA